MVDALQVEGIWSRDFDRVAAMAGQQAHSGQRAGCRNRRASIVRHQHEIVIQGRQWHHGRAMVWYRVRASDGMPPGISRAGACACTRPFEPDRRACFGRRVTPRAHVNMCCRAADDAKLSRDRRRSANSPGNCLPEDGRVVRTVGGKMIPRIVWCSTSLFGVGRGNRRLPRRWARANGSVLQRQFKLIGIRLL